MSRGIAFEEWGAIDQHVDSRHTDNITAAGGWECPEHEGGVPC